MVALAEQVPGFKHPHPNRLQFKAAGVDWPVCGQRFLVFGPLEVDALVGDHREALVQQADADQGFAPGLVVADGDGSLVELGGTQVGERLYQAGEDSVQGVVLNAEF